MLATKAKSLTSVKSKYLYHHTKVLILRLKNNDITISTWYTKYRSSYPLENHQAERRDLDYSLAVLLPEMTKLNSNLLKISSI